MQPYRTALHHLNLALDALLNDGDVMLIANIAYPIRLCENAILDQQQLIVAQRARHPCSATDAENP